MLESDWPVFGLPLAELKAALSAVEKLVIPIDKRVLNVRVLKDGRVEVRTGEIRGGRAGCGHDLQLQNGEQGWAVTEVFEWKS